MSTKKALLMILDGWGIGKGDNADVIISDNSKIEPDKGLDLTEKEANDYAAPFWLIGSFPAVRRSIYRSGRG